MKIDSISLRSRTESTLSTLFQSPTLAYIINLPSYCDCKGVLGGCYTRCYTHSCIIPPGYCIKV